MDIHSTSEPASQRIGRWWWISFQPFKKLQQLPSSYFTFSSAHRQGTSQPFRDLPWGVMHYLSNDTTLQEPTEEYAGYPAILRHGYNEAKQEVLKGAVKDRTTFIHQIRRKDQRYCLGNWQRRTGPRSSIRSREKIKDTAWVTEQRRTGPCSSVRLRKKMNEIGWVTSNPQLPSKSILFFNCHLLYANSKK